MESYFSSLANSSPTATFNGKPNLGKDPPRNPVDNDAIAFTTDTSINPCIKLNFITDSIGAYKNPVVLNAQGQPAITLRAFEIPIAGISDNGKMYVNLRDGSRRSFFNPNRGGRIGR